MTREEVIAELKYARAMTEFNPMTGEVCFRNDEDKRQAKAFDIAIEILKQEPCEDYISRQAVLDINKSHHGQMPNHINHQIWQEIKDLPLVTPQPKTGYWQDTGSGQECSECGEIQYGYDSFRNYCANCGARMVETQESEE